MPPQNVVGECVCPDDFGDHFRRVRVDVVESEGVLEIPKRQFNIPALSVHPSDDVLWKASGIRESGHDDEPLSAAFFLVHLQFAQSDFVRIFGVFFRGHPCGPLRLFPGHDMVQRSDLLSSSKVDIPGGVHGEHTVNSSPAKIGKEEETRKVAVSEQDGA